MAEEYERVRLGYPAGLVDKACAVGNLAPGARVVEIGPGTGKLTRDLAARGLVIEAVEPDADLAAVARRIVSEPSVRFHIGTFEDVELPEGMFTAVFAATSYHWIDPDVGWRKVASLLEPGGVLALFGHGSGTQGPIDEEISRVWDEVTVSKWERIGDDAFWTGAESRVGNVSELWSWLSRHKLARPEAATLFRDVELTREPVEHTLSVDDYIARIRTTNNYLHLGSEGRQRLEYGLAAVLEAHGGTYPARYSAVLVTARRA